MSNVPTGYSIAYNWANEPYLVKDTSPTSLENVVVAPPSGSLQIPTLGYVPTDPALTSEPVATPAIEATPTTPAESFTEEATEAPADEAKEDTAPADLEALNHDTSLFDNLVGHQLVSLNDWANAHPEAPLGGSIRAKLNGLANDYAATKDS